jgi:hypothetical protein
LAWCGRGFSLLREGRELELRLFPKFKARAGAASVRSS